MLGAVVFAVVAWAASFVVKKPLAVAVAGGMAGAVWTAPRIPAAVGLGTWGHLAFILFLGAMAACAAGAVALVRALRPPREYVLEVVEFDPAEAYETSPDTVGMERHFNPARPGEARVPGMLRAGLFLVGGLATSDLAWAASVISGVRGRWAGRGRGPVETPQIGHGLRFGIGRSRHDDRAAA